MNVYKCGNSACKAKGITFYWRGPEERVKCHMCGEEVLFVRTLSEKEEKEFRDLWKGLFSS